MTSRKALERAAEFIQEGYKFNYSITGRNIEITDAIKNYIMEKFTKLERFNIRIIDVVVVMEVQRFNHRVDIMLKGNNILIKAHAVTEDMYGSIEQAVQKVQNQIRRYHRKITDHQTRAGSVIDVAVDVYQSSRQEQLDEINSEIEEENQRRLSAPFNGHAILKKEKLTLRTLTTEEALLKMELTGDSFLIFKGEEDRLTKVIYRLEDGNLGIVELSK